MCRRQLWAHELVSILLPVFSLALDAAVSCLVARAALFQDDARCFDTQTEPAEPREALQLHRLRRVVHTQADHTSLRKAQIGVADAEDSANDPEALLLWRQVVQGEHHCVAGAVLNRRLQRCELGGSSHDHDGQDMALVDLVNANISTAENISNVDSSQRTVIRRRPFPARFARPGE